MAKIESASFDLSYLESLAGGNSLVHRLDPRIKVLTTALFIVCVVSFGKYTISAMLPFAIFLIVFAGVAAVPVEYLLKKILIVSPFAVMVGIFNPLLDQHPVLHLLGVTITGGWLSFFSILLRFSLTVGGVLLLIATTGFNGVCMAMTRLGMPKIFAVQLLMLYRYIFVLIDEALRMYRARTLRSFRKQAMRLSTFGHLIGQLLLRTLGRAERIHLAMLCRGFDGTIRIRRSLRLTGRDLFTLIGCASVFLAARYYDLPVIAGNLLTGILS